MRLRLIHPRGLSWLLAAGAFVAGHQLGVAEGLTTAVLAEIRSGASADLAAQRGDQFQATPTLPPPPGCRRVIVIGDSLMDNAEPWLVAELEDAGFVSLIDAHHTRRISSAVRDPYSGVKAARRARVEWGEADCWVVGLGSNDLIYGAGETAVAEALIDEMLGAVTVGAMVFWVNLDYHGDPAVAFDFPGATARFNSALASRAATDPLLEVIDWYTYAESNRDWFFDPVHVNREGSIARAIFTVSVLPRSG